MVYLDLTKDRAEGEFVALTSALSEALTLPGVQHLMNLTIPIPHVKIHIAPVSA